MAKPSRNVAFRKVNVDQYDEENYVDDATADDEGSAGPNDTELQAMLAKNRNADALSYVLSNAPLNNKNQAVKDRALQAVLRVLLSFKAAEIDAALGSLDQTKLDVLMKYIYRGFELPSEGSSAQLLVWHDKVFAVGGLGSIVRTLTDRKRV
jgi:actin related protein 2/3 complex subunit 5